MTAVTVLVPAYNNESYIDECLSSIAGQTLGDLEIICLNDGSTDATGSIMHEWAERDQRFSVIDKPNTGYGNTMNRGLDAASGEYLTVLESDDIFPPTACEDMYAFVKGNDDLDFCKADAQEFLGDGESRTFTENRASQIAACYEGVFNPSADPGRWLSRSGQPGMYRLDFLQSKGIRHNETPGASFQDTGFWAQLMFCAQRVRYLDKTCYLIRRDNPFSSEVDASKVYTICDEYDFIRKRASDLPGIDHEKCLLATAFFAFQGYRWNCTRLKGNALRQFIARFARDMIAFDEEGHLDRAYFTPNDRDELDKLMADPDAYYYENWILSQEVAQATASLARENAELRSQLDRIRTSFRYRIGTAITAPARLLRRRG